MRWRGSCRSRSSPGAMVTEEGGVNIVTKPPRQNPGRREVIGIIDAAAAAQFLLPTASLENAAGEFVQAHRRRARSPASSTPRSSADGVTRTVDLRRKDPAIYPLAAADLGRALDQGATRTSAQEMADLLDYVAGPARSREQVGQLPDGHAPLHAGAH